MRKCLATFGVGRCEEEHAVTIRGKQIYAERHGYDLVVPQLVAGDGSHPAWHKMPAVAALLGEYEAVLWLDSDVGVVDPSVDILAESSLPCSLVVHDTEDGNVPNTGVVVYRGEVAAQMCSQVWNARADTSIPKAHCWWEQAAWIAMFSSLRGVLWDEIDYRWNPHLHDRRGIPHDCRFFHATQFHDRVGELQKRCIG